MTDVIDVIIPVLDEEDSITLVIRDIPKELVRSIYVCDNGSTDESATRAKAAGAVVISEPQRGYGAACLKAIQYISVDALQVKPDIIVFLDGDYSDRPSELPRLIDKLISEDLDLVIGSRVLGNSEKGSLGLVQQYGNILSTWLIRRLFNYHYTDLGPFRAIRFDRLTKMQMCDRNYGWTVEMQVKAAKQKLRVGEVPVSYHKRIGKSKISGTLKGILGASSKILYTIFKSFVKG